MAKNKGGRPSTSTWTAVLNYTMYDEDGKLSKKTTTLKGKDGSMFWENKAAALKGLSDLQIDGKVRVDLFLRDNDTIKIIEPVPVSVITYIVKEEEEIEEEEEKTEDDIIPTETKKHQTTPKELKEMSEENQPLKDEIHNLVTNKKETDDPEIPDIGNE